MSEQSDARVPLSVLVPVKNEAANMRGCLASVSFAQEIVVVDSASTDGTQEAAEAAGARIVQFIWNGKFPRKKNWALENIPWRHEWVRIVDADERVTLPAAQSLDVQPTITRLPRARLRHGKPLDQDHVCLGRTVSHFARLAIFFTIQPVLGALR